MIAALPIVLECGEPLARKVRYVFDTLLMAAGVPVVYVSAPPATGPWIFYGAEKPASTSLDRCLPIAHVPASWRLFDGKADVDSASDVDGLCAVFTQVAPGFGSGSDLAFDLAANAFYFLSSWSERNGPEGATRQLYPESVFGRLGVPQDIVDRYLVRIQERLASLCDRLGAPRWTPRRWPGDAAFAIVLSHDVDFLPTGFMSTVQQGVRSVLRHLIRKRDPGSAARAAMGFAGAVFRGRDPYGCVPEIIRREKALGVRSSFQVAVGHRHPRDVGYRIEDDRIRDYLRVVPDSGFDLCLHGSYRSTEDPSWYLEEVDLLARRLARPVGSRQHYLSFDYDTLFSAQERAGIQFDMSMGFPDRTGPRAGFSYPYFPFCIREDRPHDVLQISLFLMDATLSGYLELKAHQAWAPCEEALLDLRRKRGCVSVVWHPIVFGGARDPGYDQLYWRIIEEVRGAGGLATDGRTINDYWREDARHYESFAAARASCIRPSSPST